MTVPRIVTVPPVRRLWLVGFGPRSKADPWHWTRIPLTHPGYQHVVALAELRQGETTLGTLVFNPRTHWLQVEALASPLPRVVKSFMTRGFWFVAYETEIVVRVLWPRLTTCVEALKWLLGIRDFWVITARQLYRRLRALGARPVLHVKET